MRLCSPSTRCYVFGKPVDRDYLGIIYYPSLPGSRRCGMMIKYRMPLVPSKVRCKLDALNAESVLFLSLQ